LTYDAIRNTFGVMAIQSFRCRDTEELFLTGTNQRFGNIARVALRKLDYLNAAAVLSDLRAPPGNYLEALKRDRTASTASGSTISGAFALSGHRLVLLTWRSATITKNGVSACSLYSLR
jgi:plasmid maintenance system killer protein